MQEGHLCVQEGRTGEDRLDARRASVCIGGEDWRGGLEGTDLMQEGHLCVQEGRTGGERLDAGRLSVCTGGEDWRGQT